MHSSVREIRRGMHCDLYLPDQHACRLCVHETIPVSIRDTHLAIVTDIADKSGCHHPVDQGDCENCYGGAKWLPRGYPALGVPAEKKRISEISFLIAPE